MKKKTKTIFFLQKNMIKKKGQVADVICSHPFNKNAISKLLDSAQFDSTRTKILFSFFSQKT